MTPVEQLRTTLAALSLTAIDARLEGLLESAHIEELLPWKVAGKLGPIQQQAA
jgi:hypothetical protein